MKRLILIFTFYSFSQNLNAQAFYVGDTSCNYIRLDTNVRTINPGNFGFWSSTKSYGLDYDQDMVNDIIFTKSSNGANGGSGTWSATRLNCTSSTGVEFVYKPGTVSCYSGPGNLLDSLIPGTPLKASLNWSSTLPNSCTYDTYYQMGNTTGCGYFQPIYNPFFDLRYYIGFRKILTGDTIYGWILLHYKISSNLYEIAAMGYKHTLLNNTVTPVFTSTVNEVCLGGSVTLSGSPSGGVFSGAGVSGNVFNSSFTGSGIQNVYYSKGCTQAAVKTITVHPLPTISFTNSQTSTCINSTLALTASPSGGSFSGPGVSANTFSSSSLGTTAVSYNYTDGFGCSNTNTVSISTFTAPVINVTSTSTLSCPAESVTLSVSGASNYTWSTGGLSPSIVITPTSPTIYTVTGAFSSGSCPPSSVSFTQAAGNPTVTIPSSTNAICPGYSAGIFASGAASYTWSTGSNNYWISTNPTVTTTYSVIGMNPGGCSDTAFCTVNVVVPPVVTVTSSQSVSCPGDPIILYLSPGFSNYEIYDSISFQWLAASNSTSVIVTPTASITYKIRIYYNGPNNCFYWKYFHQKVIQNNIINVVPSKTLVCVGDTVTLNLSGSKSYTVTLGSTTYTTNTSTLIVSPLSFSTSPYIIYGDSAVSGCQAVGYFSLNVSGCVGIQELKEGQNQFIIYPNPNSGEFEIKGTKEETIFISNELGQLISTKILTQENNYLVKLNNLQSGVYFVGDKLSRQKIVVIK